MEKNKCLDTMPSKWGECMVELKYYLNLYGRRSNSTRDHDNCIVIILDTSIKMFIISLNKKNIKMLSITNLSFW